MKMAVIRYQNKENKPNWVKMTNYGIFHGKKNEKPTLELHYHDCDEYWFVIEGSIRVQMDDKEFIVNSGDVFCTPMGSEHNLLEILEDTTVLWMEDELKGQKRTGHLHK